MTSAASSKPLYESAGWRDDGVQREEEVFGVTITEMRYRRAL